MFLPPEEIGKFIDSFGSSSGRFRALGARVNMHSGFLIAIMKCHFSLQSALGKHLRNGMSLYLVGHSLGGSLAMAAASTGAIPDWFTGERRVIMFGSPPIYYETASSTDDMQISATLVVNECDV